MAPTDEELAHGDPRSGGTGGVGSDSVGGAGNAGAIGNSSGEGGTPAAGGSEGGDAGGANVSAGEAGAANTGAGGSGGASAGTSSNGGSSGGLAGGSSGGGESGGGSSGAGTGGTADCVPDITSDNPLAAALSDAFDDDSAEPGWNLFTSDLSCAEESNASVTFTLHETPNQGFYCFYRTTQYYDLTCGAIAVKVPEITRQVVGAQTFIWLEPSAGGRLNLIAEGGGFVFGPEDAPAVNVDYSAVDDLWWRLREGVEQDERQLFFETSRDGTAWLERARIPRPFALDEVRISIGSGTWQDVTNPGRGVFACYNQPSGCD